MENVVVYMKSILLVFTFLVARVSGQLVSCEGTSFPDEAGWVRADRLFLADRWLSDGQLVQQAQVVLAGQQEVGEDDFYRRSLAGFSESPTMFFEWRMVTDGWREAIPDVAPAPFVAGGQAGISYHFTIAQDRVRFIDSDNGVLYLDVAADIWHVYRLELLDDASYAWSIDGELVGSGPAPQPYPTADSFIVFGARASPGVPTITVWWDYIRVGVIPDDASGDYDSDAGVTLIDHYFVVDCLTKDGPGIFGGPKENAGPGCRFADFDADSDVDLLDFAEFQNGFGG